jgi:integrase
MSGVLPISLAEARRKYACVGSAISNKGLRPLRRDFPEDWHRLLAAGPPAVTLGPELTIEAWLRAGVGGLLVPRAASDQWVRRSRGVAQWLVKAVGRTRVVEWDEDGLLDWERVYAAWALSEGRSSELVGRDVSLFRRAIWEGQRALGMRPRVRHKAPGRCKRRGGDPVPRPVTPPTAVARMLEALRGSGLAQLMIALLVGCGLWEGEALALRAGDLDLAGQRVHVHGGAVRGKPGQVADRWVSLPEWVWNLLWLAIPGLSSMPMESLLFPSRVDPARPRSSFRRTFLAAAKRAGLEPHERVCWALYGPAALRRLGQAVLRNNGAPRMLVRGTVVSAPKGSRRRRERPVERKSREIASAWRVLVHPPTGSGWRLRVPRRAQRTVGAGEPEVLWRERRAAVEPPELPWNCRVDSPPLGSRAAVKHRGGAGSAARPAEAMSRRRAPAAGDASAEGNLAVAAIVGVAGGYLLGEWVKGR